MNERLSGYLEFVKTPTGTIITCIALAVLLWGCPTAYSIASNTWNAANRIPLPPGCIPAGPNDQPGKFTPNSDIITFPPHIQLLDPKKYSIVGAQLHSDFIGVALNARLAFAYSPKFFSQTETDIVETIAICDRFASWTLTEDLNHEWSDARFKAGEIRQAWDDYWQE